MTLPLPALRALPLAIGLVAALAAPALAELTVDVSFKAVGDVELDDRLGETLNAANHYINIDDCADYAAGEIDVTFGKLSDYILGDFSYALMYAQPGVTCPITLNPATTTVGCYVVEPGDDVTSATVTMRVSLDKLIGSACDSGDSGDAHLYLVIQESGAQTTSSKTVDVTVDLKRPDPPEVTEVTGGDARFTVEWDDSGAEDDTKYIVYWSTDAISDTEADGVHHKSGFTGSSATIDSGVSNDETLHVAVVAVDEADNESVLSNSLTVTPEQTEDFWEAYQAAGGTDPGGFCFIATAAYGSALEPELDTLRAFRDQMLMPTEGGSALVSSYYQHGRRWAAWIADKPVARAIVRVLLVPVVLAAKVILTFGPYVAFLMLLGAFALFRWARRRVTSGTFSFMSSELR